MTPAQMETMACAAFRRIFGREPSRSESNVNEQGNGYALAASNGPETKGWPALRIEWASDGTSWCDICAPNGESGESRGGRTPTHALRYAEAAYRRGQR